MTGLSISTLATQRSDAHVSPSLSTGNLLANVFCTSLDRMCSYSILLDPFEVATMQKLYIMRAGYQYLNINSVDELMSDIEAALHSMGSCTRANLYRMLSERCSKLVKELCRAGVYIKPKEDNCVEVFTANLKTLMRVTESKYKDLIDSTDLSLGIISRYMNGGEPSLGAFVEIADFFGVRINDFLRSDFPVELYDAENKCMKSPYESWRPEKYRNDTMGVEVYKKEIEEEVLSSSDAVMVVEDFFMDVKMAIELWGKKL
ncbi:MAG: hypothetical protein LUD29_04140 [Clostridia bacterium]|nr:hypothetical protein [Clostridia bacterium]